MILMGSITSCGLSGKSKHSGGAESQSADEAKGPEEVRAPPMRTIGEIVSVHPDEKFVLVKRFLQAGAFGSELIASVSPEGTTSSLILTGEKLGRFYAADIQEGKPSRGDLVVIRRTDGKGPPNGRSEPSSKMENITE
ncbi:MAG: hypothetical protein CMP29_01860 [Roseibacillus sp.]|nr:hypothetical protein [Roseibacillus sp.]